MDERIQQMINKRYFNKQLLAAFFFLISTVSLQAQVTRTNITFENGRFTLHGELILPDTSNNAPVIIFLVGSGENSSYRTLYKDFVENNLEDLFLSEGIGLLYFDKRGVGDSEGRWQRSDLYDRAEDTKAAIEFLKTQGRVDSTRIGIVGHSQGGWVAQIMADQYKDDIVFIASLAAPTFDVKLQITNDLYSRYICKGKSPEEAMDKATKKAISDINWVSWFPVTKPWRQLKVINEFDPAPHLREITMPAFFAFAENDYFVYPGWAIGALNETFDNKVPENFSLHIIPAANHDFRMADMCTPDTEVTDEPFSDYFQQVFRTWILDHI